MKMIRAHIFVSGLVQGVFFRDSARRKAQELGVVGWVKNLADGRVEIIAEGEKEKVESLIEWARKGPVGAQVNNLDVKLSNSQGEFDSFEVSC